MLSVVTGASCRAYAKSRGGPGGARRELEDLLAAINHHAKKNFTAAKLESSCQLRAHPGSLDS